MARGRSVPGGARGGDGIQAPRPLRARIATGVAALAAAATLAAYPCLQDLRLQWLVLSLGCAALALLAVGLAAGWRAPVGFGLTLLGAQYAVLFDAHGASLDEATPIYAAGFLLVAELSYWSLERRVGAWSEEGLLLWRLAHLIGVCSGAAVLAALVLVAAASGGGGGVALEGLGAAAAVGALAVVALLVRRSALR